MRLQTIISHRRSLILSIPECLHRENSEAAVKWSLAGSSGAVTAGHPLWDLEEKGSLPHANSYRNNT